MRASICGAHSSFTQEMRLRSKPEQVQELHRIAYRYDTLRTHTRKGAKGSIALMLMQEEAARAAEAAAASVVPEEPTAVTLLNMKGEFQKV